MIGAGLFSGGKDSLYAIYLTEKSGIDVKYLICLIPNLPYPSAHSENIDALKILADSMEKQLIIVDMRNRGALINVLRESEANILIAGDIFIEDHVHWLMGICEEAGIRLAEPLFRRDTLDLFHEILDSGFEYVVVGVDRRFLKENILGFRVSRDTADTFLSMIGSADPLGENGEFHTIVTRCPLYKYDFEVKSVRKMEDGDIVYLSVMLRPSAKESSQTGSVKIIW